MLDPRTITSADWPSLAGLVSLLWVVVVFNVGFATFLLLSHAVAPSLMATGHLKPGLAKLRPLLYLAGFVCLAVTVFAVINWITGLSVVYSIYPRRLF